MTEQHEPLPSDEIVAQYEWRYRRKHLFFALLMLALALLPRIPLPAFIADSTGIESLRGFAYDGWVGWPGHNKKLNDLEAARDKAQESGDTKTYEDLKVRIGQMHKQYTEADMLIQKVLATGLPLLGIAWGVWTWHATRGRYRLTRSTLEIPGQTTIELSDIREIDKTRWERKGIAVVHYQAHQPQRMRSFHLDDFAYQRSPTDDILERLEAYLAPPPEIPAQTVEGVSAQSPEPQ